MRLRMLATCAALVLMSGCYHVNVVTDSRPTSNRITKDWQWAFVYGLVPPSTISADEEGCNNGVSMVHTHRSFLNMLVGALTWNLGTSLSAEVGCSAAAPQPDGAASSEDGEGEPGDGEEDDDS